MNGGGTYPEQEVVLDWMKKHGVIVPRDAVNELIRDVTVFRLDVQEALLRACDDDHEEWDRRLQEVRDSKPQAKDGED
jgi:hypothetical protein